MAIEGVEGLGAAKKGEGRKKAKKCPAKRRARKSSKKGARKAKRAGKKSGKKYSVSVGGTKMSCTKYRIKKGPRKGTTGAICSVAK